MRENNNMEEPGSKRPSGLTALCILTFIGSGAFCISHFVMAAAFNTYKDLFLYNSIYADLYESFPPIKDAMEGIIALGPNFFWVSFLLYVGSVTGAILMFNRKLNGFHVYAISQILLVLWPMLKAEINVTNILATVCFIALYALYIPFLKNTAPKPPYDPNKQ